MQVLLEHGAVVREPSGVSPAVPRLQRLVSEIQLSPTVQGVLAARIDRLAAEAKALLHTLAVLGHTCSWSLLRQVVEQPEAELHRLLAHLQAAEFIYSGQRSRNRSIRSSTLSSRTWPTARCRQRGGGHS